MSDDRLPVIAEITSEAHARCLAIGGGALEAVEALRAERTGVRPALTVTHVYDAPPPEPGLAL